MRIVGIDEAGRGPVLGPLIIGAVLVDERGLGEIHELGVRDSKQLSAKRRVELYNALSRSCLTDCECIAPDAINVPDSNLNVLELQAVLRLLGRLEADVVYLDAFSAPDKIARAISAARPGLKVIAEYKADETYPVVSAASIIAKVTRDRRIEELAGRYGKIGSGYPSDPVTRRWLAEHFQKHASLDQLPPMVRRKWSTVAAIREQVTLRRSGASAGERTT